jgi:murein DD-endopeptidase MepM/ murein hydrolase activator NlpD
MKNAIALRVQRLRRVAPFIGLVWGIIWLMGAAIHLPQAVAQSDAQKPFILPFKEPPGPDTWLLAQTYGNTVGAYRQRDTTYGAGQGIHFGIDFSASCGTEIVAMADGIVFAVDNLNFGSLPHNLMIDHPGLGYASFYGHLLEPPALEVGQRVKAGDVVALSGDPAETCYGRPHLHMEIRDLRHWRKYNPVILIQADWDNLALIGPFSQTFERDLDNPRKWQYLDDQPEIVVGGPLLNDFANPWPPDRQRP